jgi:hypothetical protein
MAVKRSEIDTSEAEGDWLISIASQAGWAPQHHPCRHCSGHRTPESVGTQQVHDININFSGVSLTLICVKGSPSGAGSKERRSEQQVRAACLTCVHISPHNPKSFQVRASKPRTEHHTPTQSNHDINVQN